MPEAIGGSYRPQSGWGQYGYAQMQQRQQPPATPAASRGASPQSAVQPAADKGKSGGANNNLGEKYRCKTCEERTYTDGSNDPGVSMKTPTKVAPQSAASAVMGHEREHVTRNAAKAQAEGREVISSSVTIHTNICPECGKTYVSGGTTRTVTADKQQTRNPNAGKQLGIPSLDIRA